MAYFQGESGIRWIARDDLLDKTGSDRSHLMAQGMVRVKCSDGTTYYGSGSAIGTRFVLTSASNIYFRNKDVINDSIHFLPASKEPQMESVKVTQVYFPEEFKTSDKENYALLVLERDILKIGSCFSLEPGRMLYLSETRASIDGFPSSICDQILLESRSWGVQFNYSIDSSEESINYTIDKTQGLAGAGIYIKHYKYNIIGVHTENNSNSDMICSAPYLNQDRTDKIKQWIFQYCLEYLGLPNDNSTFNEDLMFNYLTGRYFLFLKFHRRKDLNKTLRNITTARISDLQILDLSCINIGVQGAEYLGHGILYNTISLNLAFNNLGLRGAQFILEAKMCRLEKLNLDGNNIKDGPLTRGLSSMNLKSLSLMNNSIGTVGVTSITSYLQDLTYLNLSSNQIKDTGATNIANSLPPRLKYLNLENNSIGPRGGKRLARSRIPGIIELYLGGNNLGDSGARHFTRISSGNLEVLDLSDNDISIDLQETLKIIYEWRLII